MKSSGLCVFSTMALLLATTYANASPAMSYTKQVRLRDGKTATCIVNGHGPETLTGAAISTLTTAEKNEAEVDAIAPLRGNRTQKNKYPDPVTAPRVACS
jgi:hypothetical protein